ncbi:hypothetical protein [Actinoplanes couchii]|nr:hypothetical protein [Actinoplanes couchii]MDR6319289.1 hypothetical protein [Actinoplanes couchii]
MTEQAHPHETSTRLPVPEAAATSTWALLALATAALATILLRRRNPEA